MEVKKMFYTMGEVSEMFDVSNSLIRYWEKQFSVIKPVRNKKGNRQFTPQDIENFKLIYHLVKERGMTLEGAKKSLRSAKLPMNRDVELMDRLQNMRALLLEVREVLKDGGESISDDATQTEVKVVPIEPAPTPLSEQQQSEEPQVETESAPTVPETPEAPQTTEPAATVPTKPRTTTNNRKRVEGSEEKELFAFYEQKLF